MDRRFEAAFDSLLARREEGETFDSVLRSTHRRQLIGALAGAGHRDPVLANAIATELLNRLNRAAYRGAFLASVGLLVIMYLAEWILTGTFFVFEEGNWYYLAAADAAVATFAFMMLQLSRGRFKTLAFSIRLAKRGNF